jgi:hypothetical protein
MKVAQICGTLSGWEIEESRIGMQKNNAAGWKEERGRTWSADVSSCVPERV